MNEHSKHPFHEPYSDQAMRLERSRVLLAEDDREFRRVIAGSLKASGYDVLEAANGLELLDELATMILYGRSDRAPQIIISDIRMPGVTGMSVLEGLRQSSWKVPIILMTAFGDRKVHEQADRLGVTAFFDKPFRVRDLITAVRALREPTIWIPADETEV